MFYFYDKFSIYNMEIFAWLDPNSEQLGKRIKKEKQLEVMIRLESNLGELIGKDEYWRP